MRWLVAACWLSLGLTGAASFAGAFWPFELITHFTPHLAAASLLLAGAAVWSCVWTPALAAGLALALAVSGLLGVRTVSISAHDGPGLTVLWANVWNRRLAADQTLAFARKRGADVVIFGESPYDAGSLVAAGGADYPYTYDLAQDIAGLPSTITVLSRTELLNPAARIPPENDKRPMAEFGVEINGSRVAVGAVHAFKPSFPRRLRQRNSTIESATSQVKGAYLLVGDFNATMWTPALRDSGLRRAGHPLFESTWITSWPLIGLAIDHAFVGDGLTVSQYEVGPYLGSDHRALLLRVHPR
jgi:endonuclease/exonuclease/phosphatase (EEP) superfamily protein YafD